MVLLFSLKEVFDRSANLLVGAKRATATADKPNVFIIDLIATWTNRTARTLAQVEKS